MEIPLSFPKKLLSIVAAGSMVVACDRVVLEEQLQETNATIRAAIDSDSAAVRTSDFCANLEKRNDVPIERVGSSTILAPKIGESSQTSILFGKGVKAVFVNGQEAVFKCTWGNPEDTPQKMQRTGGFLRMEVAVKDQNRRELQIYTDGEVDNLTGGFRKDFDGVLDEVTFIDVCEDRVKRTLDINDRTLSVEKDEKSKETAQFARLVEQGLDALERSAVSHYSVAQHNADYDKANLECKQQK